MYNKLLPFCFLLVLASCSTQQKVLTMADLKPVARFYATLKGEIPEKPMYMMSLYNDQRLELQGYTQIEKIGGHTTMLSDTEYKNMLAVLEKNKLGHFIFLDSNHEYSYDIIYYPLKKEASMTDAKVIAPNENTMLVMSDLDKYLNYKNWYKKADAPKLYSDIATNEVLVTIQPTADAKAIADALPNFKAKVKHCVNPTNFTWCMSFNEGTQAGFMEALRKNPAVVGTFPNPMLKQAENLAIYNEQELIVQFRENTTIEEWVKNYTPYQMKTVKRVAPNLNYWVVKFDASTINAKDLITLIKQDTKVIEAQTNKKVLPRE